MNSVNISPEELLKWFQKHQETAKKCRKNWYEKNKEIHNAKIHCVICGGSHSKCHTKQHVNSKKHQKALNLMFDQNSQF